MMTTQTIQQAIKPFAVLACILLAHSQTAQATLTPGFDAKEYMTLMALFDDTFDNNNRFDASDVQNALQDYRRVYIAPEVAFKNRWALFVNDAQKTAVIAIRGTIQDTDSWAANYFFAMIPAQGALQVGERSLPYKFADNPQSAVHAGWAIATLAMADDVEAQIKQQYARGIKDFNIFGHSQGAALTYLMTSYLKYRQQAGFLPRDIVFKTYSSAAPKPGNLQYAYDYDFLTRNGWGYRIVNSADWVTETPFTVQSVQSLADTNPLAHPEQLDKANPLLKTAVGKLIKYPVKTQALYTKYFGSGVFKLKVQALMPNLQEPNYVQDLNYTPAGAPIVLMPDAAFAATFTQQPNLSERDQVWINHKNAVYYWLVKHWYLKDKRYLKDKHGQNPKQDNPPTTAKQAN